MRHFFLILSFISFLSFNSKAQYQYIPMAVDGANWLMVFGDEDYTVFDYYILRLEGDTIINGEDYKVLHRIDNPNLSDTIDINSGYVYGFIRDDINEKKVYYKAAFVEDAFLLCPQVDEEYLLCDFNKTIGDDINLCNGEVQFTILFDVLTNIYDAPRRLISSDDQALIEGVGNSKGLLRASITHAAKGHFLIDFCVGDIHKCFSNYYDDNTGNFTENNKQWNILTSSNFNGSKKTSKYRLSETLEYRQGFYKRLLVSNEENGNSFESTDISLRQSGQKIYYRDKYREYLLYDLGLAIGDTMRIQFSSFDFKEYVVSAIDSIEHFGVKRKALQLYCAGDENGAFYGIFTWAEGIGDINFGIGAPLDGCQTDNEDFLLCYYENDEIKYNNSDFNACWITPTIEIITDQIKIIPNPAYDIIKIEGLDNLEGKFKIYNDSGQLLKSNYLSNDIDVSQLTEGVYIIHLFDQEKIYQSRFVKI